MCNAAWKTACAGGSGNRIVAASRSSAESRTGAVTAGVGEAGTSRGACGTPPAQPPPRRNSASRADLKVPIEPEAAIYPQFARQL